MSSTTIHKTNIIIATIGSARASDGESVHTNFTGGSNGWCVVKTSLAWAVTVLESHRGHIWRSNTSLCGDTAQRPQQFIVHDATNHHASPGKPQLMRGVLHVVFYWLYTTLGWLSANPVADSVAGAKQFDHERYRATRLSTKRLNERMAVDWLDRTQAGRNDRARIGLGWWSIPANGFVPLGPGALES